MFDINEKCDKCGKSLFIIHPWEMFNCNCPDESWASHPWNQAIHHTNESAPVNQKKPYIDLNQDFPGIVSLFMYDGAVAKGLTALGQTIMRRPGRGLSVGNRELIAAWVSKLNDCNFCHLSHKECAKGFLGRGLVEEFFEEQDSEVLSPKMQRLAVVAMCVQALDRDTLPYAILNARGEGATEEEIHDTVLVAAFFSMCNRYVDGLGTTYQPGEPEQGGKGLVEYGYTMGVRRFFREVLPKLWRGWMRPTTEVH